MEVYESAAHEIPGESENSFTGDLFISRSPNYWTHTRGPLVESQ